jgi:hypothetical protein
MCTSPFAMPALGFPKWSRRRRDSGAFALAPVGATDLRFCPVAVCKTHRRRASCSTPTLRYGLCRISITDRRRAQNHFVDAEPPEQNEKAAPAPASTASMFGSATVYLDLEKKDSHRATVPPIEVLQLAAYLPRCLEPGTNVTVVPVADVPTETFEVKKTEELDEQPFCLNQLQAINPVPRWIEFKPRADRNPEMPFEAVAIHPASAAAKNMPSAKLASADLPPEMDRKTISAAVDVDGDGRVDLVFTEKDVDELASGEHWHRAAGTWKKIANWAAD